MELEFSLLLFRPPTCPEIPEIFILSLNIPNELVSSNILHFASKFLKFNFLLFLHVLLFSHVLI